MSVVYVMIREILQMFSKKNTFVGAMIGSKGQNLGTKVSKNAGNFVSQNF